MQWLCHWLVRRPGFTSQIRKEHLRHCQLMAAQTAVHMHRPYVPLDARPKPYQFKGSNEGPGGRPTPPLPQPAPPPPPKSIEQAMKEPYTIRGDSSGGRSRGAIADMNTGAQLTATLMRD
jgi:hypothetical protein